MKYEVIIYIVCLFFASITHVHTLSPYSVLRLAPGASDLEVEKQYKKLRSRNRNSRTKKTMIRSAYSSIMNQRKYKNNKEQQAEPQVAKNLYSDDLNTHIDEAYMYGYRLPDEYDDGRYFQSTFNETQYILNRLNKSEQNKKTAKIIVFFTSIIFKILPCICIFCLFRRRAGEENLFRDVLNRARNGYGNYGRTANRRR